MRFKALFILLFVTPFVAFASDGGEISYKGVYQGKDLYIMNPMLDYGKKYCVTEVTVNGVLYDEELKTSAFRVAFDHLDFQFGESYEVVIRHRGNCKPTLVNPEVLYPLSTYEVVDYKLGYNNLFRFTTDNESGKLKFYIEEFRWGRWVDVAEVEGKGGPGQNSYSAQVYPFDGKNKLRIYQEDHMHRRNYSDTIYIDYKREETVEIVTNLRRVRRNIEFSGETRYIVINEFGEELITGHGDEIDVSELIRGTYFLNYENKYTSFRKR